MFYVEEFEIFPIAMLQLMEVFKWERTVKYGRWYYRQWTKKEIASVREGGLEPPVMVLKKKYKLNR